MYFVLYLNLHFQYMQRQSHFSQSITGWRAVWPVVWLACFFAEFQILWLFSEKTTTNTFHISSSNISTTLIFCNVSRSNRDWRILVQHNPAWAQGGLSAGIHARTWANYAYRLECAVFLINSENSLEKENQGKDPPNWLKLGGSISLTRPDIDTNTDTGSNVQIEGHVVCKIKDLWEVSLSYIGHIVLQPFIR